MRKVVVIVIISTMSYVMCCLPGVCCSIHRTRLILKHSDVEWTAYIGTERNKIDSVYLTVVLQLASRVSKDQEEVR